MSVKFLGRIMATVLIGVFLIIVSFHISYQYNITEDVSTFKLVYPSLHFGIGIFFGIVSLLCWNLDRIVCTEN